MQEFMFLQQQKQKRLEKFQDEEKKTAYMKEVAGIVGESEDAVRI